MKTTLAFALLRTFKMTALVLASATLLACDNVTGIDRDQDSDNAATGNVQGLVAANGLGVSRVSARISQDGIGIRLVETNDTGEFFFRALPVGQYDIELLNLSGFELPQNTDARRAITTQSVFVSGGSTASVAFDLFEKAEEVQNNR